MITDEVPIMRDGVFNGTQVCAFHVTSTMPQWHNGNNGKGR